MFHTYILYSASRDRFYVGSTGLDLHQRLRKHLSDHKGYTTTAKDWAIVNSKVFDTRTEAIAYEREIKSWKSSKRIKDLLDSSAGSGHPA